MRLISILLFLIIVPVSGNAQICNFENIRATTPSAQFTDHGDGTVTDNGSGLMWKKCSEGQSWGVSICEGGASTYTWKTALKYVQTLNNGGGFAGYIDWHLPNINELASIVEEQCSYPAINLSVFPDAPTGGFWSSSPYSDGFSWAIFFQEGSKYQYDNNNYYGANVRLVRGGQ